MVVGLLFFCSNVSAHEKLSKGETVYVSIYSNVYSGPKLRPLPLAGMLSIRNTDPTHAITIYLADYFDTKGNKITGYIKEAIQLKPLESTFFYIDTYDTSGGPGANFIVKWRSEKRVNQPIIEGVMLGIRSQQGISFISPGKVITEHNK
jgi:hypothetical protein